MDEEQKRWKDQWYSAWGDREILRLSCAVLAWMLIGVVFAIATDSGTVLGIFFLALFIFVAVGPRWRFGYFLVRRILGNKNLPTQPYPGKVRWPPTEQRPWWSYIPGLWGLLMTLILLYLFFKYFSK